MYIIDTVFNILDLFNKYNNKKLISRMTNIPRTTIINWINKYNNNLTNLTNRIKYTINKKKYNNNFTNIELNKFVLSEIYNDPFIKRSNLIMKIFNKFSIKFTLNKITNLYKHLKITFKKPKYHIIRSINFLDKITQKRKEFLENIQKENFDKIISIDETGFNMFNSKQKGCSIRK